MQESDRKVILQNVNDLLFEITIVECQLSKSLDNTTPEYLHAWNSLCRARRQIEVSHNLLDGKLSAAEYMKDPLELPLYYYT